MFRAVTGLALILASLCAQAAFHGRLPATLGGTDYQAYYDTALNITWAADANLSQTSGYDANGLMSWSGAQTWLAALNTASYLGATNWRLPSADVNADTTVIDCSADTEPNCRDTEMGYTYWQNLVTASSTSPFTNVQPSRYWSGTLFGAPNTLLAWTFDFSNGLHAPTVTIVGELYAWAVRPGDIDADADGVAESQDNCTLVANPTQLDSDGDGYGNRCDGDLGSPAPGNGATNAQDFAIFRTKLGTADPVADLNGNGVVNAQDYAIFRTLLGSPPGPSGLHP